MKGNIPRLLVIIGLLATITVACALIPSTEAPTGSAPNPDAPEASNTISADNLLKTADAFRTQIADINSNATATAIAFQQTQAASTPNPLASLTPSESASPTPTGIPELSNVPEDVPIPNGALINPFASTKIVSYSTLLEFVFLVSYYEREMPLRGWTSVPQGSYLAPNSARLLFEKPDRMADISIQTNLITQKNSVVIELKNR